MDRERLTTLADFLDTVPEEKFDIGIWFNKCRTAGCAVGWATTIPEFKNDGLELHSVAGGFNSPCYKSNYSDYAIQDFFRLTSTQSGYLFYGRAYYDWNTKPYEVAARIRELLADPSSI